MPGSRDGQWLLIFAVIFAFSVLVMSTFLSEILRSGYEVSRGLSDIPYYEVRALIFETYRAYRNGDWNFKDNETLEALLSEVFARHGYSLNLTLYNDTSGPIPILHINGSLKTESVNVTFRDKKLIHVGYG